MVSSVLAPAPSGSNGYVDDSDQYGTYYNRLAEQVPDLDVSRAPYVYARMRRDPQITAVLQAYLLPILRANFSVNPAGCRPEVAQRVADDLGLPITGLDVPGPFRRRGVNFGHHLAEALRTVLTYGFAPFSLAAEDDGTVTRLSGLYPRLPHTIESIETDPRTGALISATQEKPLIISSPGVEKMLRKDLLWYVREREGANWRGVSILRAAYGPWLLKHEMWRVHGISNRRNGAGHPVMEALAGTSPTQAQLDSAARMAAGIRSGDQSGAASPPGFRLRLAGVEGSLPDTLSFIRYLDQQISRMALAGMLDLGDTPNGSRALGAEFVDLFMLALQALADEVAGTITADVAQRIVDWNYGEDEAVPQVDISDVGADHAVTAEALNSLLTAGALSADPRLEEYVRRNWRLPARDASAPPAAPPAPPVPSPEEPAGTVPAAPGGTVAAAAARPPVVFRRAMTDVEASAKTDFAAVQTQWSDDLDALIKAWGPISRAQRQAIVAAVEDAVTANDPSALARLDPPTDEAAAALQAAMESTAADAAVEMHDEANRQGVDVPLPDVDPNRLSGVAAAIAGMLGAGLASSAGRKALQVWGPASTPAEVGTAVDTHLATLSDSALRDSLGGALTAAQNAGRVAVLADAPPATYAASEILDASTCTPCQAIDGTTYASLDDAEADYANGGYAECQGGLRCRGILVAVWGDQ